MVVCKTHLEPSTLGVQGKIFTGFLLANLSELSSTIGKEREYCPLTRIVEEVALLQ